MTDLRKAAEMALEALNSCEWDHDWDEMPYQTFDNDLVNNAKEGLHQALAQPEQELIGDEWTPCVKLPLVVHVRKQRKNETHVSTREGITPVKPDDLIMRGVAGEEYPIGRELFERTYTLDTAPPSKPDNLLRQSEQEGWRWAKECEAEVKRLRTLLAEGGQGCGECGVTVSEGYALYCVKCVEPMFKKEWVSLTDEERSDVIGDIFGNIFAAPQKSLSLARAIEAKLKEKNNG